MQMHIDIMYIDAHMQMHIYGWMHVDMHMADARPNADAESKVKYRC